MISPPNDFRIRWTFAPAAAGPIDLTTELQQTRSRLTLRRTLTTKLADQFRDKGEFRRGEPYLFFKDLDGYEVEIAFELPTPVYPKSSTK